MKEDTIFLISPEAWGINLLSKHYYALHLSKNHAVYFINPATGFTDIPFGNMKIKLSPINENLISVEYKNLVPRLNNWPSFLRNFVYKIQANRIKKKIGSSPNIVWSFDPRRFSHQKVWGAEKSIYHSVDLHPDSEESIIARKSDFVFALSDIIQNNLKKYVSAIKKIGHGFHLNDMHVHEKIDLPGKNTIKAVYTGNFHQHINYDLLVELSNKNFDCDFILIGPTSPNNLSNSTIDKSYLDKLKNQPNVFMLGSIPGTELQLYLNSADICLVLFKKEYELIHHNPHKLMAYFATGKCVLANNIDEYKNASEKLILQVSQNEILKQFELVKENLKEWNSLANCELRINFAKANTYEIKIEEIFELLNQ